jgi:hypothetical protein
MFPSDMYYEIVRFIPIRELLVLRLVSNEFKYGANLYDRKIIANSTQPIRQCFPNAIVTRMLRVIIAEELFDDFIHLKKVNVGKDLSPNALYKLPYLETLWCYLTAPSFRYSTNLRNLTICYSSITDQALTHLPNLVKLSMTKCEQITTFQSLKSLKILELSNMTMADESLHGMSLEYLCLAICHNITSDGIQSLKSLKQLHLIHQVLIDDSAFKNMKIEELYICGTTSITDHGIGALTQLRILHVEPTVDPFVYIDSTIHGKGFRFLRHLNCLWLRGSTITNCDDFKHLDELRLGQCTIMDDRINLWKKIKIISLIETVCTPFDHTEIESLIIEDCPGMVDVRRNLNREIVIID